MSATEQWRPISWAPDYSVSSLGRVISYRRPKNPRVLSPSTNGFGYLMVSLTAGDQRITRTIHRLVAEAFVGPRPDGMETRHLDGDKSNNAASNLSYCTASVNTLDQVVHGVHVNARKTHCPSGHVYDRTNTQFAYGRRYCLACRATKSAGRTRQAVAA